MPTGCCSSSSCRRRTWQHPCRADAKQVPLIQDKAPGNTLNMPLQKILVISPIWNLHQGLSKLCWLSSPGDTNQFEVVIKEGICMPAPSHPAAGSLKSGADEPEQRGRGNALPQVPLLQEDQGPLGNPPKQNRGKQGKRGQSHRGGLRGSMTGDEPRSTGLEVPNNTYCYLNGQFSGIGMARVLLGIFLCVTRCSDEFAVAPAGPTEEGARSC